MAAADSGQARAVAGPPQQHPPGYVGKLPLSLKAGWGVGSMGCLGMLYIVNVFVLYFLVNHLGVDPALAGLILFITRIYDVFSDPMIGFLSDTTRSRWGRRRPWMALGAFMSGLALILTFNAPALASMNALAIYQLIVLIAYFTGYTLFYVPFMAMPAEMTDDYNERTSIMAWRVGYSNFAGILIGAGMPALINYMGADRRAYGVVAILVGILIAATMMTTVLLTRRARGSCPARSRTAIRSPITFGRWRTTGPSLLWPRSRPRCTWASASTAARCCSIMTYFLERGEGGLALSTLAGNFAGLCTVPLWAYFARGKDKRWVYMVAIVGSAITLISWAFATPTEGDVVFVLRSCFVGIFGAGGLTIGFSMLPDTIEYDRIRTGKVRTALYTGVLGFVEKTGFALGPLLMGFYFSAAGLVETTLGAVEQPDSAITAIVNGKAWIPATLQALALFWLVSYRLTEKQLADLRGAAGASGAPAPARE